jgi:localization factor PodJL
MRPTSRQLAIAALILMIPLNAMFLYLVLGSSKSTAHADVHTSTDVIPLSERIVETSTRNASNESSVAKPLDPLPPESLSRISPPASAEPIAHQTASAEPAAEGGAIELPPASVGPLTLRRAASDGDMSAQFEVAARLAEGKGVDQDFKAAVLWYQRSASRGFAQSQYRLGTHYERGLGVEKDPERARVWYLRAAEQGNVKAMHNLAVLGANRPDGKPDYAEALKWFGEAATYNLPDSQFNLAVLHENGLGLTKDPKTAYVWFSLAARSGDREALKRREAMKAQLSADAVAAADEEVRTFRAKTQVPAVNDPRIAGEQWKRRQVTEN